MEIDGRDCHNTLKYLYKKKQHYHKNVTYYVRWWPYELLLQCMDAGVVSLHLLGPYTVGGGKKSWLNRIFY